MAELAFDAARHEYRVGGRVVPSVTQVLGILTDFGAVPAEVLARAAEFGTHVHQACALWNAGRLDEDSLDPALAPYLEGWRKFIRECEVEVLDSEFHVYHAGLKYAGTVDVLAKWKGRTHVLDIKTASVLSPSWRPQTAAYREACLQSQLVCCPTRYCVQLIGAGDYRLHKSADPVDLAIFTSALNIYRWQHAGS